MKNIKIYVLLGIVLVGMIGVSSCTKQQTEDQKRIREVNNSKTNQEIFVETVNDEDINIDRFVNSLSNDVELILVTEYGTQNISHSKDSNKWNSWLVESKIDMTFDYKAVISIRSDNVKLIKSNDKVLISYSPADIYVNSVEITSKVALDGSKAFGEGYSSDELIALERIAVKQIKEQVEEDVNITYSSQQALEEYLTNLGNSFNVDVTFIK